MPKTPRRRPCLLRRSSAQTAMARGCGVVWTRVSITRVPVQKSARFSRALLRLACASSVGHLAATAQLVQHARRRCEACGASRRRKGHKGSARRRNAHICSPTWPGVSWLHRESGAGRGLAARAGPWPAWPAAYLPVLQSRQRLWQLPTQPAASVVYRFVGLGTRARRRNRSKGALSAGESAVARPQPYLEAWRSMQLPCQRQAHAQACLNNLRCVIIMRTYSSLCSGAPRGALPA
jgi:hypothetical protein